MLSLNTSLLLQHTSDQMVTAASIPTNLVDKRKRLTVLPDRLVSSGIHLTDHLPINNEMVYTMTDVNMLKWNALIMQNYTLKINKVIHKVTNVLN